MASIGPRLPLTPTTQATPTRRDISFGLPQASDSLVAGEPQVLGQVKKRTRLPEKPTPPGHCSIGCSTLRSPLESGCGLKPALEPVPSPIGYAAVSLARRSSGISSRTQCPRHRRRRDRQAHGAPHAVSGRATRDHRQPDDGSCGANRRGHRRSNCGIVGRYGRA